jgi:hypothetical protein
VGLPEYEAEALDITHQNWDMNKSIIEYNTNDMEESKRRIGLCSGDLGSTHSSTKFYTYLPEGYNMVLLVLSHIALCSMHITLVAFVVGYKFPSL